MRTLRVYLDTSIPNFLLAEDAPEYRRATEQLRDEVTAGRFDPYVSEVVLTELQDAPPELGRRLQDALLAFGPEVLEVLPQAEEVAELIVTRGVIPARHRADAMHLAVAITHEMDMLLSWNFRHLVKWKTRVSVNALVAPLGYKGIEILSPLEVIEDAV